SEDTSALKSSARFHRDAAVCGNAPANPPQLHRALSRQRCRHLRHLSASGGRTGRKIRLQGLGRPCEPETRHLAATWWKPDILFDTFGAMAAIEVLGA